MAAKGKIVQKATDGIKREKGFFYVLDKKLNIRAIKRKASASSNSEDSEEVEKPKKKTKNNKKKEK